MYFEPDPIFSKPRTLTPTRSRTTWRICPISIVVLKILFKNEGTKETHDLTHPGGIPEFLGRLITAGQKPTVTEAPFTLVRGNGDKMEVALQWTESTDEAIRSYVNGIRTSAGGTHESGFKSGVAAPFANT